MLCLLLDKHTRGINREIREEPLLSYMETGRVSFRTVGVQTRYINIARGNRQGNNAFLGYESECWDTKQMIRELIREPNIEMETINRYILLCKDEDVGEIFNNEIGEIIRLGNMNLGRALIERIIRHKYSNYGFNQLHLDVLTKSTNISKIFAPSLSKKAIGNYQITPTQQHA